VVSVPDANSVRAQTSALDLAPSVETISGAELEALIERDFIAYDPDYLEHRRVYGARLHGLASRLAETQATGNPMECSNQIFLEGKWLYHYTAYWARLDRQLAFNVDPTFFSSVADEFYFGVSFLDVIG